METTITLSKDKYDKLVNDAKALTELPKLVGMSKEELSSSLKDLSYYKELNDNLYKQINGYEVRVYELDSRLETQRWLHGDIDHLRSIIRDKDKTIKGHYEDWAIARKVISALSVALIGTLSYFILFN